MNHIVLPLFVFLTVFGVNASEGLSTNYQAVQTNRRGYLISVHLFTGGLEVSCVSKSFPLLVIVGENVTKATFHFGEP